MPLQDDFVRTSLRIPPKLYERVKEAASSGDRSINDELIARIAASFDPPPAPPAEDVARMFRSLQRQIVARKPIAPPRRRLKKGK